MQSIGCAPDLILVHGRIYTEDPAQPWAQALAVRKHRIMAVGSDAEVLPLADGATQQIALAGHPVLPAPGEAPPPPPTRALGPAA